MAPFGVCLIMHLTYRVGESGSARLQSCDRVATAGWRHLASVGSGAPSTLPDESSRLAHTNKFVVALRPCSTTRLAASLGVNVAIGADIHLV